MLPVSAPRSSEPPASAYAAWGVVCIVWGTTYLAIRIALESIPPGLLAGMRFATAGTLLCGYVIARGDRLPPRSAWPVQGLIGVLMLGIGNGLIVVAEQWIPSGIAAVSVASAPFWMTGIDAWRGGERLTARAATGFVIGFSGIVMLLWPDLHLDDGGGGSFVLGIVLGQLACFGWSIGSSLSKRVTVHGHILGASALQQLFGGLTMLAIGLAVGEWRDVSFTARTLSAELYLVAFGSLGAYSSYIYALQRLPISTVSLYAYVNPIIAVVLGTLIAKEPFGPRIVLAAGMVLGGIAVVRSVPLEIRSSKAAEVTK
ncbi:MAG TPA: EamA family transporter [Vicinamibacterales bacterium]|jgi:drug/metabolite transporter (DMT)-like permease|nr:EamA family transporter [Vicinamibacterales bacterium]